MKKLKTVMALVALVLCLVFGAERVFAAEKFAWNFADCEIKDIIYAVSVDTGISIACDETVSGKSDFKFVGEDFEIAFDSFTASARLYVDKGDAVWKVSRIRFDKVNSIETEYCLDAIDVPAVLVFERISSALNFAITYDSLPVLGMTIHLKNQSEENLIKNIVRCIPGFDFEKTESGYHVYKSSAKQDIRTAGKIKLRTEIDGRIETDIKNCTMTEVLEELFTQNKKAFCLLSNTDVKTVRTNFIAKDFENCLSLICSQNGFKYTFLDGVYYIQSDVNARDGLLSGKKEWVQFSLKYAQAEKIISLLQKRFGKIETVVSTSNNSFWVCVNENEKVEMQKFINESDVEKKTYFIALKNIKGEEFISRLPPSVEKNEITLADGNGGIYFSGTHNAYEKLLKEIELCDKPVKRLRYDLLILQYEDSSDNRWSSSFSARRIKKGDVSNLSAQLGSVMGFNLNVVTAFGLDFAAQLQSSINENKTQVFADTSLYGVAGKQISFASTNTFRYRDNNLDPETGKPIYSGITKEIVSGLKLDVIGFVSENGMITSTVTASITRRGTDSSAMTGNPPPTTEKLVTTEVRGKTGEPVILSGLIQDSESEEAQRSPILSKIPLLGNLFKNKTKTAEKSQMVIYLVPFIESEDGEMNLDMVNETSKKYNAEWAENRKENLCKILNLN